MTDAEIFETHGCVVVKEFLDSQTISIISQYFENKIRRGEWEEGSEGKHTVSKYFYYADPLVEVLLHQSKNAIEEVVGKELLPTYSYSRIYQPGEQLEPHTDRPSCEVSVTVNVAFSGEMSPIYMQYKHNDPEKHVLNPGDAVVYKGCETMHWRRPMKDNQLNVQFMLHYVDKNGPYAEFEKDKRPAYGMNSTTWSQ
jgi:hypothetical protein